MGWLPLTARLCSSKPGSGDLTRVFDSESPYRFDFRLKKLVQLPTATRCQADKSKTSRLIFVDNLSTWLNGRDA